ncbi:MAG: GH3 auxin-responsive promoter family protein [Saprospiraceae bacterium]|nr:GH3 auxin-responsive promoter family protein [Saprospiraceae bacterium]
MKWLVNEAVKQYLHLRMKRIERYMMRPEEAQERWLRKIIDRGRNTEFGKRYDFKSISTNETFRARIPAHEYDDLKADINRMMHGEKDVLWPGEVNWYSKSSGTTSDRSKYIPVPYGNLFNCHIAGVWDSMALLYANKPDMAAFKYKNLVVPGSYQSLADYPKTKVGDVSAILVQHMPTIGRMFYTPDFDVVLQPNFEEKLQKIAEITSKQNDIGLFGGVPTWLIVLFRLILEKTGKSNMLEVWPNLQAYMHGGVGFEPYRDTFKQLIPSDSFVYQEVYNASEGFFGAQCDLGKNDMLLLANNGVFYEFVPMEEWDEEHPKTKLLSEVEVGQVYAVMISCNNGLWRYLPGDTIVFTRKQPYCFQIVGRTQQFINAFGEEVMVGDTDKALVDACRQMNAVVSEYTAAPVYFHGEGSRGGHEWIIEFDQAPADLEKFKEVLDQSLQRINSDYEAKRYKSLALDQLRLRAVPRGTFLRWMRARGKFGNQNKVPRLANHRRFVEEVVRYQFE